MSQKKMNTIVIIVVAVLLAASVAGLILNKVLNRIPDNDIHTVGNTAGNLYNGGTFCESDGRIYFSNSYDNGALYVMNSDLSGIRKLADNDASYINAGGDYIYFRQSGQSNASGTGLGYVLKQQGIFRLRKDGRKLKGLYRGVLNNLTLVGSRLYYQNLSNAYYLKFCYTPIGGSGTNEISDLYLDPSCAYAGSIWYTGSEEDMYLYTYDTTTGETTMRLNYDMWHPVIADGAVYFMDIHNNYRIVRYDFSTGSADVITEDRVDFFNYLDGQIFYQTPEGDGALKCVNVRTLNISVIDPGYHTDLQLTSEYAFFKVYGESVPIYMTPTQNPGTVSEFTQALIAVTD